MRYRVSNRMFWAAVVLGGCAIISAPVVGQRQEQSMVWVNGKYVGMASVYNGLTMVPLRAIAEIMGAKVNYDPSLRKIDIFSDTPPAITSSTGGSINGKTTSTQVSLSDTQSIWYSIDGAEAGLKCKDATYINGKFSCVLNVSKDFYTHDDNKLIKARFILSLFDDAGNMFYRGPAEAIGIGSYGGTYLLTTDYISTTTPATFKLQFSNSTVPKD
jgi:hypothetical protein